MSNTEKAIKDIRLSRNGVSGKAGAIQPEGPALDQLFKSAIWLVREARTTGQVSTDIY
jgi:hypothetical protein